MVVVEISGENQQGEVESRNESCAEARKLG
jgi:hypothetical protein